MFDSVPPGSDPGITTTAIPHPGAGAGLADGVPLERLEAQICELAGHLAAATCRFLVLVGEFDARRGWATWEMNSCAQWLSWKCQLSPGTAREHVRVARALRDLPVLRAGFGAGRLSYAKIRALTRIATPATERGLAEIAGPMTASQLDRFARAHRQVTRADDATARTRRHLHLLPARRHRPARQPRPARPGPGPGHRGLPRRRHHPGHHHPRLVRRTPQPA
jgi:Domain of unknown function (DUF222)